MKKHNFLHRGIGWIERELEATLAILILLAAVVGYTLAGTEAVTSALATPDLTTQDTSASFIIGTNSYDSLSFDSTFVSGKTYRVRKLFLQPSTASTITGIGLRGTTSENYNATITLTSAYSGKVYVVGNSAGATLNGTTITNQNTAVFVADATQIILNFKGIENSFRGISINPPNTNTVSADEIATLSLVPAVTTTLVGNNRSFIAIATNSSGAAISSNTLALEWTVTTSPAGIATVNSDGLVTTTGAGTVTVKVIADGKTASATITVVSAPVAVTPATTTPNTTTPTTTTPTATNTIADNGATSLLEKIGNILAPASAATTTPTTATITPAVATAAIFSDASVIERVATTGTTNISQTEIATATKGMTLISKIATTVRINFAQIVSDLKTIAVGTTITNPAGTVIYQKPSALQAISTWVRSITSGASAGTLHIKAEDEGGEAL
jgi:hypothetical protein